MDLPIKARYMLPTLYGIPDSPCMVFEHEIDGDREIMGLNVDTAKVFNFTKDPSVDDYFYYVVAEKRRIISLTSCRWK